MIRNYALMLVVSHFNSHSTCNDSHCMHSTGQLCNVVHCTALRCTALHPTAVLLSSPLTSTTPLSHTHPYFTLPCSSLPYCYSLQVALLFCEHLFKVSALSKSFIIHSFIRCCASARLTIRSTCRTVTKTK